MVRDLVEATVSGNLHPTVKKRLSEVVGPLQVYSRLAELEIASGEAPRFPGKGYVALPEDTAEKAKGWAEGEAEREKQREAFLGRLQATAEKAKVWAEDEAEREVFLGRLKAVGEDPRAALEGMG